MATWKQMPGRLANRGPRWSGILLVVVFLAGCSPTESVDASERSTTPTPTADAALPSTAPTTAAPASATAPSSTLPERPHWLGTRDLTPTDGYAVAIGLDTPEELTDRRFAAIDRLPAPPLDGEFTAIVGPLEGAELEASTWEEGCPVDPGDLRYLTMTFWGFDERPHTGDMIVHADVADDITGVFEALYAARFPIEEMRIITDADIDAPKSGDGNVTTSFVCRTVRGGSSFSEHAYGLAIDVNPFLNPYLRGEILLPELARHYLPRGLGAPGQVTDGDVVTRAFADVGWEWGGNWSSLVDYQHFALNNQ